MTKMFAQSGAGKEHPPPLLSTPGRLYHLRLHYLKNPLLIFCSGGNTECRSIQHSLVVIVDKRKRMYVYSTFKMWALKKASKNTASISITFVYGIRST